MPRSLFICFLIAGLTACNNRAPLTQEAAVANAIKTEPNVAMFERLYPGAEHFISYYSGAYGQPHWNSSTLIHGRYELTMQFDVHLDRSGAKATAIEPPHFWLNERHHVQRLPDGRLNISYAPNGGTEFGVDEWGKLIASSGDLRVLNIREIDESPVVETSDPAPRIWHQAEPID